MTDFDKWLNTPDPWIGKRVEINSHLDSWMRGDRYATVISQEGVQGVTMLYRLQFNSGSVKVFAETNFRLVPGLVQ